MTFKSAIFKYKKIIMLALVLIAVITCVVATYVTEYNINKIHVEELFTVEETRKFKTEREFIENFSSFVIKSTSEIDPSTDPETGETDLGERIFTVNAKLEEGKNLKKLSLKLCLAADWIHYISKLGTSSSDMNLSVEHTITINIDRIFPANGNLWFVTVKQPKLYVLATWSENNTHYYTYLEYDYAEYGLYK